MAAGDAAREHLVTLVRERRIGGGAWWRSRCSCGKYASGLHGSPGRAESAGREHAKAKSAGR